jgi:hypothetical protein
MYDHKRESSKWGLKRCQNVECKSVTKDSSTLTSYAYHKRDKNAAINMRKI